MKIIYALVDYRGYFGSKVNSIPYNSGMDHEILKKCFLESGYEVVFMSFSDVINYSNSFWAGKPVIYTSSEDTGFEYKSFIEDIIYYLELCRALVIPAFKYLRANNNKVFMELLRHQINNDALSNIKTQVYGCLEEISKFSDTLFYPLVFKSAKGAMSKGVGLAFNKNDLVKKLKKISRSRKWSRELWEYGRKIKYGGYKRESKFRKKFIVQNLIPGLDGDYKVLIFSNKYYVLKRGLKQSDFRASGSGIRNFEKQLPKGLLDFAFSLFEILNIPNVSLDIATDGLTFFLIEFQCIYFGSYTLTYSDYYWQKREGLFELVETKSELEMEYVNSIINFLSLQ
jgi:hypothetical protein